MDMEHHLISGTVKQPPQLAPWGQVSTEFTGFCDPSHYQMQRMLGDDRRRPDRPAPGDEWPTILPS